MSEVFDAPEAPLESRREGHGCFFYGCITALVLMVLAGAGMYVAYRSLMGKIREAVATYTAPAPQPIPTVELPPEERKSILDRIDAYRATIEAVPTKDDPRILTDEQRTLVLTADEINAWIEAQPDFKGKVAVSIDGDQLKARISLPLPDLLGMKGRYLNGEARLAVSLDDGNPRVFLRDVRVKGLPLPDDLRKVIEHSNLAERRPTKPGEPPDELPILRVRRLDSVDVKDGKLIIVARKEPAAAVPSESDAGAATKPDEGSTPPEKAARPDETPPPDKAKKSDEPAKPGEAPPPEKATKPDEPATSKDASKRAEPPAANRDRASESDQ